MRILKVRPYLDAKLDIYEDVNRTTPMMPHCEKFVQLRVPSRNGGSVGSLLKEGGSPEGLASLPS